MDADDVPPDVFAAVMHDLAKVNTVTLARPPTLAWLARASRGLDSFSVLDVGFGDGDMLRAVARAFPQARLTGIDINPRSAPAASAVTPPGMNIDYRTGDAFALPDRFDFIVSSLTAHHMDDAGLVTFLRWMEASAVRGWFVNDLHRHWIAWRGFQALAWAARWHPFVRHDGAVSVTRSFRRADWARLLTAAGIRDATVEWKLPFRLCVARVRPAPLPEREGSGVGLTRVPPADFAEVPPPAPPVPGGGK